MPKSFRKSFAGQRSQRAKLFGEVHGLPIAFIVRRFSPSTASAT